MKLYYAYNGQEVTSSVQEDFDKLDNWKLINPDYVLQEDVGRDNSILKQVDGVITLKTDIEKWNEKIESNHNNLISASKDYLGLRGYHLDMRESLNLHESRGNESQRLMAEQVADFIKIVQDDLCLRMIDIQSGICELDFDFTNNNTSDPMITWSDLKLAGLQI